jgi:hypothetical protein
MFIFAVFFIILYRKITVEFFYLQYREVGILMQKYKKNRIFNGVLTQHERIIRVL